MPVKKESDWMKLVKATIKKHPNEKLPAILKMASAVYKKK